MEIIGFHAQEMKGKKETQVESKNKWARDEGEERASFQDIGREKIFNVQETKGKTELVF